MGEPSLLFYSSGPGSGNSNLYRVVLPKDPPTLPTQDGTGGTWNFQLRPAFWLGMALCDNQSAPEWTHEPCTPDSDTNVKDGADPAQSDYIGRHTGTAFLELQFYPPGWAPWPAGISCSATQWCSAMAIFGLNLDQNTGVANNNDCLHKVGLEPVSFAFMTKSGVPHAPPDPLGVVANGSTAFVPSAATDLFMNPGDVLTVDLHDTFAGLQIVIHDLTTGATGSMTASVANGWAQVNFDPKGMCTESPYAYHPMYATSSEHTRVPWAAHSYNVAFSDEIGHFEYCASVKKEGGSCLGGDGDADDAFCFSSAFSLSSGSGGAWRRTTTSTASRTSPSGPGRRGARRRTNVYIRHPSCSRARSSTDRRTTSGSRSRPTCRASRRPTSAARATGRPAPAAFNPPPGANFYPIYSTGAFNGACIWQLGGPRIKGTTNTFGGTSTAEFGPLLQSVYPVAGFAPSFRYNNFRNILSTNPCPA
ncbi:MAG TPA: hypothetical protein VGJ77_18625 [Gaiellaceae bacterium]